MAAWPVLERPGGPLVPTSCSESGASSARLEQRLRRITRVRERFEVVGNIQQRGSMRHIHPEGLPFQPGQQATAEPELPVGARRIVTGNDGVYMRHDLWGVVQKCLEDMA